MILDLEWQAGAHGPPRAVAEQGDRRCRIRPPPAESAGLVERDGPRRARVPLSAPGGLGGRRGGDHLCGVRRRGRSMGRALLPLLRGGRLRGPCACCRCPHRVRTDRAGSTPRRGIRVLPGARCASGGEPDSVRRQAWPRRRRLPGRGGAPRVLRAYDPAHRFALRTVLRRSSLVSVAPRAGLVELASIRSARGGDSSCSARCPTEPIPPHTGAGMSSAGSNPPSRTAVQG